MATRVSAAMTTGVVKNSEKTLNTGLSSAEGLVIQTNSSGKIPSQYLSTGVHLGGVAAANLLDDYEEGIWTPTILGSLSNPTVTTSTASGTYRKIGKLIYVQWLIIVTGVSGQGSGVARIGGLPFVHPSGNTYQGHISILFNDTHSNETQKGYIPGGADYINLVPTGQTQSDLGIGTISTGYLSGGGSYITS